jgi:hypothetical protein
MSGIFTSYRREDSAPHAGRLCDRLSERFGADQVFMDVDDIAPGTDFTERLRAKVASCDAMIVVIGKGWLNAVDENGRRRLDDPNDFVSLEVSHGLKRRILLIPALVAEAKMPKADELPDSLRALAQREAVTLRDDEFKRDCDEIIAALAKLPGWDRQKAAEKKRRDEELFQRKKRALLWKAPVVFLLVSFAIWWQWRQDHPSRAASPAAAAFAGEWSADVVYPWDAKHRETFFFQPEGSRVYGTASFLGYKRGIDDAKIEGDEITFGVRFQENSSDGVRDHKNYYGGTIVGNEIHFRMQDDRGSPLLEFTARKSAQAAQQGG